MYDILVLYCIYMHVCSVQWAYLLCWMKRASSPEQQTSPWLVGVQYIVHHLLCMECPLAGYFTVIKWTVCFLFLTGKFHKHLRSSPYYIEPKDRGSNFAIKHYAGPVSFYRDRVEVEEEEEEEEDKGIKLRILQRILLFRWCMRHLDSWRKIGTHSKWMSSGWCKEQVGTCTWPWLLLLLHFLLFHFSLPPLPPPLLPSSCLSSSSPPPSLSLSLSLSLSQPHCTAAVSFPTRPHWKSCPPFYIWSYSFFCPVT